MDWELDYGDPPTEGDILQVLRRRDLQPNGTLYLVTHWRVVVQRDPLPGVIRLALIVERCDGTDLDQPGLRVLQMTWSPR